MYIRIIIERLRVYFWGFQTRLLLADFQRTKKKSLKRPKKSFYISFLCQYFEINNDSKRNIEFHGLLIRCTCRYILLCLYVKYARIKFIYIYTYTHILIGYSVLIVYNNYIVVQDMCNIEQFIKKKYNI